MANRWETMETVTDLFSWAPKSLQMVTAVMKLKDYDKPRQHKHRGGSSGAKQKTGFIQEFYHICNTLKDNKGQTSYSQRMDIQIWKGRNLKLLSWIKVKVSL